MARAGGGLGCAVVWLQPWSSAGVLRDPGDRTTLPLGVLTAKQYMLMETEDEELCQKCQQWQGDGGLAL